MPDTPLTTLDSRQQKLIGNARRAFDKGNLEYVLTVCGEVLRDQPGCLSVRRLQRMAQLRQSKGSGWMGKALGGLTALPFSLSKAKDPQENLARAEKLLAGDPGNVSALNLLADAAKGFDWPETAAFAYEAIRELEPDNRDNLLALGEACLNAGKPDDALQVADEILKINPVDGEAQSLMRKASIARTTTQGHWEREGDYREKLKDEKTSIALERDAHQDELTPKSRETKSEEAIESKLGPLESARELVERYPGDLEARFRLAELLLDSGETEPAIAQYQQSQKNPKLRVQSLLGLARCFRARELTDLAVAQLTTAKGELASLDDLKKDVIYELGVCYEVLKQPEEAIAQFKEIYTEDIGFRDVARKINDYYSSSNS